MAIRIYNTLTGQKEELTPMRAGKLGLYVCGVTVYDHSHLGHARCYLAFDAIYRHLRHRGLDVTYVRNFTDCDDKIINRANERGVDATVVSEQYIASFTEDARTLGLAKPDIEPKVTEHIPEIVALIERLIEKGAAYEAGGDVMFAIDKFPSYGKLSHRNLDELQSGARVEVDTRKRNPLDFVLWKAAKPGEPKWDSPWGPGRPGWHIECSAMGMKYLGETFDLHGGGHDLIFPHHENEIAQSEAATGKPFVKTWLHNGFLNIDEQKMSKSLGNFFTLKDVLVRFDPEVVRFFMLQSHYRSPINFSDAGLAEAQRRVEYLFETLRKLSELPTLPEVPAASETLDPARVDGALSSFLEAMDDDFNTAGAIGHMSDLTRYANILLEKPKGVDKQKAHKTMLRLYAHLREAGSVLGMFQASPDAWLAARRTRACAERNIDPAHVEGLIAARAQARQEKNFARADAVRAELTSLGVALEDSPTGTRWRVASEQPE